jgi:Na+-transporting methylmalonyl-CoA/oxaloacetate decarboxylase beta subunit
VSSQLFIVFTTGLLMSLLMSRLMSLLMSLSVPPVISAENSGICVYPMSIRVFAFLPLIFRDEARLEYSSLPLYCVH